MNKWIEKLLQKDYTTVSKWCNDHTQPNLYMLVRIAKVLNVNVHKIICLIKTE